MKIEFYIHQYDVARFLKTTKFVSLHQPNQNPKDPNNNNLFKFIADVKEVDIKFLNNVPSEIARFNQD